MSVFRDDENRLEFGLVPGMVQLKDGRSGSSVFEGGLVESVLQVHLAIENVVLDVHLAERRNELSLVFVLQRVCVGGLEVDEVTQNSPCVH